MKKLFYSLLLFSVFTQTSAQEFSWAKRFGGDGEDVIRSMYADNNSNTYTTGYFTDNAIFGEELQQTDLISNGWFDIFIQKTSPNGELVWVKGIGGISDDYGTAITVDNDGNVYVTGIYQETVDFNPEGAPQTLTSYGAQDIFVLKLDSNGNFIWVKGIGGEGYEETNSIQVSSTGEIYISGYFYGEVDFDPSENEYKLSPTGIGDSFFVKLSSEGDLDWVKTIGGASAMALPSDIKLCNNQLYALGHFKKTVDFDPSVTGEHTITTQVFDIYLLKLDLSGNFISVATTQGESGSGTTPMSLSVDSDGNAYIAGYFGGTVNFGPTVEHHGQYTFTTNGYYNGFVMKLNNTGDLLWANHLAPLTDEASSLAYGLVTNNYQEVSLTGYITGKIKFDDIELEQETEHYMIAYAAMLDEEGKFIYAKQFGGSNFIDTHCIAKDANNNIYLGGTFEELANLNPTENGSYYVYSRGFRDSYIIKLNNNSISAIENYHYAENHITVYPNPSSGIFWLKSDESLAGKIYQVYDMLGKKLVAGKIGLSEELQFESLPKGVYILKIDDKYQTKIIKN